MSDLQTVIDNSRHIVFFGGAGVSTESGIPDFRSPEGLYSLKYEYPPEQILSHDFFFSHTEIFYRFCRERIFLTGKKPNAAHFRLAELERAGKLDAVITQNIDGLHFSAGSKRVYELHGSVNSFTCTGCRRSCGLDYVLSYPHTVAKCSVCGQVLKPDVVLYGEPLDSELLNLSVGAIRSADTLIVGGTSLAVNPAAALVNYFRGDNLVLINLEPTAADGRASLIIREKIGEVMSKISLR